VPGPTQVLKPCRAVVVCLLTHRHAWEGSGEGRLLLVSMTGCYMAVSGCLGMVLPTCWGAASPASAGGLQLTTGSGVAAPG
jgi:hypothetical protein